MGVTRPCPPVRNNIVTPRHLLEDVWCLNARVGLGNQGVRKEEVVHQEDKEKEKIEGGDEPGHQGTQGRSRKNPGEGSKITALKQKLIRDYAQNLNQQQSALTLPMASGSAQVKSRTPKSKGRPKTVGRGVGAEKEVRRGSKTLLERWLKGGERNRDTGESLEMASGMGHSASE